jgi:hypothetical protein
VRIARNAAKVKKLVARAQYKQHVIYDENLVAIQLKKTVVNLNKPRYIGMCILELSKLVMYRFHYEFIMPKFPGAKLMFTDTDSFCYWIPSKTDIYEEFKGNQEWFDFSNYPIDHPNFDYDVNNLVPGKMKDEMEGIPIIEFVGLRAKMYSIKTLIAEMDKMTAKGIMEAVTEQQITHENFKTSLYEKKRFMHTGSKILQEKHQLYTSDVRKVTLSPFNDKKWITREGDNFISHSFGNIHIPNVDQLCEVNLRIGGNEEVKDTHVEISPTVQMVNSVSRELTQSEIDQLFEEF